MRASETNAALTQHLDDAEAVKLSRQMWGHSQGGAGTSARPHRLRAARNFVRSGGLCPSLELRQAVGVVGCVGGAVPEALVSVSLENDQPCQSDER
jgi:hypothetical protein